MKKPVKKTAIVKKIEKKVETEDKSLVSIKTNKTEAVINKKKLAQKQIKRSFELQEKLDSFLESELNYQLLRDYFVYKAQSSLPDFKELIKSTSRGMTEELYALQNRYLDEIVKMTVEYDRELSSLQLVMNDSDFLIR